MALSISDIVNVAIAVSPNAVATDGYGPLVFMTKQFRPVAGEVPIRIYTSLSDVQVDFPSGEINRAATAWYSQTPKPKTFLVGAITGATGTPATAGYLTAGSAATLAALKEVTDGSMILSVDGISFTYTGIDFSDAANLSDVVNILNQHLTGCIASQDTGIFKITSTSTGINSVVLPPNETELSNALRITSSANATSSNGTDYVGLSADLSKFANAAAKAKQSFFYVAVERSLRGSAEQIEAAEWAEATGRVFGLALTGTDVLTIGNTTNNFFKAKSKSLQRTINVYAAVDSEYPEVSILGRAATVNFNVANSALILAFKKGPSITAADLTSTEMRALLSYNGNAFINVGDNVMFWNGKMADGTWFDTVQGTSWLTQKVQLNVFNMFYTSTTKIPWTDTGVAMVNHQIMLALELAKTNGLIAPGYDNEGTFYPNGYEIYSTPLELLQSQKGARIWEGSSFKAIGSGALQGAEISGTFVQ